MYRLLIADDEKIERMVLQKTLHRAVGDQCIIFEAENGREALEIYERERIQIAILDIEMPGVNGIEVAQRIRETDKACCLIFLTAYDEFSYAKKAITVRALDYLLKPYDESELLLVVEEAMRMADNNIANNMAHPDSNVAHSTDRMVHPDDKMTHSSSLPGDARTEPGHTEADEGHMQEEHGFRDARIGMVSETIEHYIQENYQQDISMQDAARSMNYSEAYFCKLFKQCFGKNFTAYLTEYRIEAAKKLLVQPMVNVRDVGKAVGYSDSNYFTKVFKRITGQSPTEYRVSTYKENQ